MSRALVFATIHLQISKVIGIFYLGALPNGNSIGPFVTLIRIPIPLECIRATEFSVFLHTGKLLEGEWNSRRRAWSSGALVGAPTAS